MRAVTKKNLKQIVLAGSMCFLALGAGVDLSPSVAQAGAGASGGGSFIYLDGAPEMADPFVKVESSISGTEYRLSAPMVNYIQGVWQLLKRYGVEDNQGNFWVQEVLGGRAVYRLVETPNELPCQDIMEIDPDKLPGVGEFQVTQYGCTKDHITYFARSEFENKPLQLQALAILHERLHSFSGDHGHSRIAPLISTLNRMINLSKAQSLGQGNEPLSPVEINQWNSALYEKAPEMGFKIVVFGQYKIQKNGGIWMQVSKNDQCVIDSESVIGVGSVILSNCKILSSRILNSVLTRSQMENSTVINSHLTFVRGTPGSQINQSRISGLGTFESGINGGTIVIAPDVSIEGLDLLLEIISSNPPTKNKLVLNPKSGKLIFNKTFENKRCHLNYWVNFGAYMFTDEKVLTEDADRFPALCEE